MRIPATSTRSIPVLALTLLLCPLTVTGRPRGDAAPSGAEQRPKVHSHLRRLLAERGPSKGWVFFRDKGATSEPLRRAALDRARRELSPRTIERRRARRSLSGLVDEHDLPVARDYVERVLATGARLSVSSAWLNAISVRGTIEQFEAIAALSFVERIEPVRRGEQQLLDGHTLRSPSIPSSSGQPGTASGFYGSSEAQLIQIGLVALHARGYTGEGVVIGILDTGFRRGHEAFNQTGHVVDVVAEYDFVDDDPNTAFEVGDPSGQHEHGTAILGTLAAYLPNQLVGAAHDAAFILCKTEDDSNEYQQEEDFYVAGLEFIEANGADLATSSLLYIDWYTQSDFDGLTAVATIGVNIATANGLICVTGAGNEGHDAIPTTSHLGTPGDAAKVITVGAVDSSGTIAWFSSDGPTADGRTKPELLARGVSTWTVCPDTDVSCLTTFSGTSLSTPLIAGAIACLLEAHPDFTGDQMRARLFRTGDYFVANGSFDPLHVLGYGIPDADAAGFDCNGNGIDDALDVSGGAEEDCNGNGLPDSCDIADGISTDANQNDVPDECDPLPLQAAGSPDPFRTPGTRGLTPAPALVIAPPAPRVGGRLRLTLGAPRADATPVVVARCDGVSLGVIPVAASESAAGAVQVEISIPDDPDLAGRVLELRAGTRDPDTGRMRWSRPTVARIAGEQAREGVSR